MDASLEPAPQGNKADRVDTGAATDPDPRGWIRVRFAHWGLAFMLDHPVAAIRAEIGKLIGYLIEYLIVLLIVLICVSAVLALVVYRAVTRARWLASHPIFGFRIITSHEVSFLAWFTFFFWLALILAVILVIILGAVLMLIPFFKAAKDTLREWSRVGSRMPLMLSFVALFFLSGDSWRLAGAISWWRLRAFVAVFALVYFGTLYRRAKRTVDQVLKHPIKVFDIPKKVRDDHPTIDRVFRTRIVGEKPGAPPGLLNLRVAAAILLTRRIVISGIIVSAALFLFGIILIGKQDTVALMNNPSPAVIGFTATFGIGKYQFFLSESLLKESLLLGALAAAYFVFANPEPDPGEKRDQDTLVVTFIRKIIALWACYQQLEVTGQSAQPAAGGTKQAAA